MNTRKIITPLVYLCGILSGAQNIDIAFDCHESADLPPVAGNSIYVFNKFNGKCVTHSDPTYSFSMCEFKINICDPGLLCFINSNSKGICATQQAIESLQFADAGMLEPAEPDGYLAQVLASKPLMFKTILAILLIALILVVLIYFKPKNKKRKRR